MLISDEISSVLIVLLSQIRW